MHSLNRPPENKKKRLEWVKWTDRKIVGHGKDKLAEVRKY